MKKAEINHINTADIKVEDLTPAMQEYLKIKHQNPDKILLYRLGDFYETFFEDAVIMSKELELTLTGREQGNLEEFLLPEFLQRLLITILKNLFKKIIKL